MPAAGITCCCPAASLAVSPQEGKHGGAHEVGLRPCVPRDRIPSSKLAGVEQWLNERPISIESSSMAIITTKELLLSYLMLRPISGKRGEDPAGQSAGSAIGAQHKRQSRRPPD